MQKFNGKNLASDNQSINRVGRGRESVLPWAPALLLSLILVSSPSLFLSLFAARCQLPAGVLEAPTVIKNWISKYGAALWGEHPLLGGPLPAGLHLDRCKHLAEKATGGNRALAGPRIVALLAPPNTILSTCPPRPISFQKMDTRRSCTHSQKILLWN